MANVPWIKKNTTLTSHDKILDLNKLKPKTNVARNRRVVITGTSAAKC